jgi:DNA polymerase alpha/epsilon subunit B/DNA polymerase alpha subunit B N-terminal
MDVTAAFRMEGLELDGAAADECRRICDTTRVTPEDLVCKWEAWAMSRGRGVGPPAAAELRDLATSLAARSNAAARTAATASVSARNPSPSSKYPTPTNKSSRHRRRPASSDDPSTSLVRRVGPPPPVMNVDDFFSYLDGPAVVPGATPQPKQSLDDGARTDVDMIPVDNPGSPSATTKHPGKDASGRQSIIVGGGAVGSGADVVLPGDDDDAASEAYASRQDIGRVLATLNGAPKKQQAAALPLDVHVLDAYRDEGNRFAYMNDDLETAAETVRTRLRSVGERILTRRGTTVPDGADNTATPEAFYNKSPNPVLALGRIRVELDSSTERSAGRINASSVVLESEDGVMVKLNLSRIKESKRPMFLSPGMIVVVEGINVNSRVFDVHAIHDSAVPLPQRGPTPTSSSSSPSPCARIIAAAGPYTLPDNLKYEPLDDLLALVARSKPDVVILLGPFVDANHKHVTSALPVSFDTLFASRVMTRLSAASRDSPSTRFVVAPSLSDVHHELVCPQPAFVVPGGTSSGVQVHMIGNPAVVRVSNKANTHEALVGITSLPTIQDLSGDCLCWETRDRFATLASHMIRQQSFYPLFPASQAVPLDMSHSARLAFPEDVNLDALVAPSVLMPFAKIADGVAVFNPGMLVRGGAGGGSYADIALPLRCSHRDESGNEQQADAVRAQIYRM